MKHPDHMTLDEIYEAANVEEGDEIEFDGCNECGVWIVGDYRCICGNRRVGWDWIEEGPGCYDFYPVAY